jgi:hypothetical protein
MYFKVIRTVDSILADKKSFDGHFQGPEPSLIVRGTILAIRFSRGLQQRQMQDPNVLHVAQVRPDPERDFRWDKVRSGPD